MLNSLDESLLPETAQQPAVDPFRIVYHGTVTPHYGVDLVVQAFAQVARWISRAEPRRRRRGRTCARAPLDRKAAMAWRIGSR